METIPAAPKTAFEVLQQSLTVALSNDFSDQIVKVV
jgi:hypothetical protein